MGLCWRIPGRDRLVGASYGVQPRVNGRVEAALVASRREERARLAPARPAPDRTVAPEATVTGGRCLVGRDPMSHARRVEPAAQARAHATWQELLAPAWAGRHGQGLQATSDEAPGLRASVAPHRGAHPAPDGFQGPHALRTAVAAPRAATPRAAAPAAPQAAATRQRVPEPLATPQGGRAQRSAGPGRPPTATPCREPAVQEGDAAPPEHPRRAGPREQVTPRLRASGPASHGVAVEHGGQRHGTLRAGALQPPMDTMRTMAHQAGLSETGRDRIAQAARGVPNRQATIAFGSGDGCSRGVNETGRRRWPTPGRPRAFPPCLSRAWPRRGRSQQARRGGRGPSACGPRWVRPAAPGGPCAWLSQVRCTKLQPSWRTGSNAPARPWRAAPGPAHGGPIPCAGSTTRDSARA